MNRRTARLHAFCVVFQFPFHYPLTIDAYNGILDNYPWITADNESDDYVYDKPTEEAYAFVSGTTAGVFNNLAAIDSIAEKFLRDWQMDRIARMDLACLRLAIYEMLFTGGVVPVAAAINESVELAKIFGTDDSAQFINGVLGSIAREQND
ncbi:MAG: transcription antitermination factor NusB [Defluviitaleaceae bacterium]|nr:transcription antitermination factor NusB [Defluviitaleaceae bacterium]